MPLAKKHGNIRGRKIFIPKKIILRSGVLPEDKGTKDPLIARYKQMKTNFDRNQPSY